MTLDFNNPEHFDRMREYALNWQNYLASQSDPADGVEYDVREATAALNVCPYGMKSHRGGDELFRINQTIRHALQSTAKLRAQVDGLKNAVETLIDCFSEDGMQRKNAIAVGRHALASLGE